MREKDIVPSIELPGVAVVAEYRGHALRAADVTDRRRVPPNIIQGVFHRQLRVRLQYLGLGAAVVSHQIRSDEFIIEPLEPGTQGRERRANRCDVRRTPSVYQRRSTTKELAHTCRGGGNCRVSPRYPRSPPSRGPLSAKQKRHSISPRCLLSFCIRRVRAPPLVIRSVI